MTSDATLREADTLIAELIELVETARSLPMSSSCVVPRERVLDLLDELREVLPPELDESRKVIAARDTLLHNAVTEAAETRKAATDAADAVLADAAANAERTVRLADERAAELIDAAEVEQARLVAASTVHQSAVAASNQLRAEAETYRDTVCGEADEYGAAVRTQADAYARAARRDAERYTTKLVTDAEQYAEQTLEDLAGTLRRAAGTADQGRLALAERRANSWHGAPPAGDDEQWPDEQGDTHGSGRVGQPIPA
jgi:cell division septum initiation protein DivIVA